MQKKKIWKEAFLYLFFGVLTTVVNYVIYFILTRALSMHYLPATFFSWLGAVLFAFVTNRRYVFQSKAVAKKEISLEFGKFVGGRLFSLGLEAAIMWIGIDLLALSDYDILVKTLGQVAVVISNYFLSKYFVFKKKAD